MRTYIQNCDQRYYQIVFLVSLFCLACFVVDIKHVSVTKLAFTLATACVAQWTISYWYAVVFEWKSVAISAIALAILLNTPSLLMYVFAALVAVSSKFVLRVGGRHVFNPTNIALVVTTLIFPSWTAITQSQWSGVSLGIVLSVALVGLFITNTVKKYDTAILFLLMLGFGLVVSKELGYTNWNGVLGVLTSLPVFVFAFFMITDPKTSPQKLYGKILYVGICVGLGFIISYQLRWYPGFLYALPVANLLVPFLDRAQGINSVWQWR